jgi:hypothetical protein
LINGRIRANQRLVASASSHPAGTAATTETPTPVEPEAVYRLFFFSPWLNKLDLGFEQL